MKDKTLQWYLGVAVAALLCAAVLCYMKRGAVREELRVLFPHSTLFSHTLSYYSPANDAQGAPYGTHALSYGYVPDTKTLVGAPLPAPILVLSDVANHYSVLDEQGKVLLSKQAFNIGKSAGLDEKNIYIPADGEIRVLDRKTLEQTDTIKLGFIAQFANVKNNRLITADESHVRIFDISDKKNIKQIFIDPIKSQSPRGADVDGDMLVVADTYGARVYGENIKTGKKLFEFPSYYSNSVYFTDDKNILVSVEHVNRVTQYNIATHAYKIVAGCALASAPGAYTKEKFDALQKKLTPAQSKLNPPKSLCAESYQGINTLFSPNGARAAKGGYLIADTDDHRVLFIKDGVIKTIIYGFNNPVDAVFLN